MPKVAHEAETRACCKGWRTVVENDLAEPLACSALFLCAIQGMFHQKPPDRAGLNLGINGDGPDAKNQIAFIQKVAVHHTAILFGDDGIYAWMFDQLGHKFDSRLGRIHV